MLCVHYISECICKRVAVGWCIKGQLRGSTLIILATDQATPLCFVFLPQVCLTGCSRDLMVRVDQLCSQHNIKVFCGDVYGYYGYMFCNLGQEHNYVE